MGWEKHGAVSMLGVRVCVCTILYIFWVLAIPWVYFLVRWANTIYSMRYCSTPCGFFLILEITAERMVEWDTGIRKRAIVPPNLLGNVFVPNFRASPPILVQPFLSWSMTLNILSDNTTKRLC